jgi:hypothetical protein
MTADPQQLTIEDYLDAAPFEGTAESATDFERLAEQTRGIFNLMKDGVWRTLEEIEAETGYPQDGVAAQLRHLKKLRFGGHALEKRRRPYGGTWEYRLMVRPQAAADEVRDAVSEPGEYQGGGGQ